MESTAVRTGQSVCIEKGCAPRISFPDQPSTGQVSPRGKRRSI